MVLAYGLKAYTCVFFMTQGHDWGRTCTRIRQAQTGLPGLILQGKGFMALDKKNYWE